MACHMRVKKLLPESSFFPGFMQQIRIKKSCRNIWTSWLILLDQKIPYFKIQRKYLGKNPYQAELHEKQKCYHENSIQRVFYCVLLYMSVFCVPPNNGTTHIIQETVFTQFSNKTEPENPRSQRKKSSQLSRSMFQTTGISTQKTSTSKPKCIRCLIFMLVSYWHTSFTLSSERQTF